MSNSRTSPVTSMNVLAEGREGGGGGGKGGKRKRGLEVCRRKRKRKREVDDTNSAPTINTKKKKKTDIGNVVYLQNPRERSAPPSRGICRYSPGPVHSGERK